VFSTVKTFGVSHGEACGSSTYFDALGHLKLVAGAGFRRASLVLYGGMLIPGINLALLNTALIIAVFGAAFAIVIILPFARCFLGCCLNFERGDDPAIVFLTSVGKCSPLIAFAVGLVVCVEGTIRNNNVAPGEDQWLLGQTLAVFAACISLIDVIRLLYNFWEPFETADHPLYQDKSVQASTDDEEGSLLMTPQLEPPSMTREEFVRTTSWGVKRDGQQGLGSLPWIDRPGYILLIFAMFPSWLVYRLISRGYTTQAD